MGDRKKIRPVRAWAWAFHPLRGYGWKDTSRRVLCFWAEPDKDRLRHRGRPTEDAVMVRVEIRPVTKKRRSKKP